VVADYLTNLEYSPEYPIPTWFAAHFPSFMDDFSIFSYCQLHDESWVPGCHGRQGVSMTLGRHLQETCGTWGGNL
jgi:hypothetical protein